MKKATVALRTTARDQVIDLTDEVRRVVREAGVRTGTCLVYCPHTTAGIGINEGHDPDVARDLLEALDRLIPWSGPYRHREGNAAAHVKAVLCGASQTILVEGGELVLGTWQSLQFYEFDGPRSRQVYVAVEGE